MTVNTHIAELKRLHAAAMAEAKSMLDAVDAANRGLTKAEQTRFDELDGTMNALNARIEAEREREALDTEAERALAPYYTAAARGSGGDTGPSWLPTRREYYDAVGEQRATGYSNAGALLATQQYSQWFDRLRTRSVVLAAGPRLIPIDGRSLQVPVLSASSTVANVDEGTAIPVSDPTLAAVVLTPIKFASLVLASNESLSDSAPALNAIIAADLLRTMATAIDVALLVGPGGLAPAKVKGLRNLAGTTAGPNLGAAGGIPTVDTFADAVAALEAAGGNPDTSAFFVSTGVWNVVRKIRAIANGSYLVNPDVSAVANTALFGVPVFVSRNIPQTEVVGASGAVCSSIILADLDQVAVGVGEDVSVQLSEDFAFNTDQVAVRCTARVDICALNPAAVVITPGAKVA